VSPLDGSHQVNAASWGLSNGVLFQFWTYV
jgi:hypothetical protein